MKYYLLTSDEGKITIFISDNKKGAPKTTTHYFHTPYLDITIDTLFIRTIDTYEEEISIKVYTKEQAIEESELNKLYYLGNFHFPTLADKIEIGNLIVPEIMFPISSTNKTVLLHIWVDKPGLASEILIKIE